MNIFKKKSKTIPFNIKNIKSPSILAALNQENNKDDYKVYINKELNHDEKLIEINNLVKKFGHKEKCKVVLNGVNLTVSKGKNLALLGGNGAGKTTLVETIAGLYKPDGGSIKYLYKYDKTFQERLGIQFQDSFYPNAITVKEVIDFMIGLYGSKISHDELIAMLNIFGINEYYKKRVSKLSGGQQQRLNALLAIIHKPTVLFLDELSTGLDITIRTNIKRFIKHYAIENGITLILVSHDTDEIAYLADEIAVLKKGKIVYFDTKENIVQEYENIEKFLIPYL
ncbi:MAG: ABC transporter ATP-binding protein [Candidatus Ureaplasma intestinipullorum]|uniref:ABC transporter ATP-binding protein n=1 Tax=Candidatus Ureaplasma intestinipullorum TaxID=2838770 RepID=A0A9E2KWA9_9BACT|nr:ABC transporter ATP-binding protein [Candidatus Ureaplasma intestinipullorum]